MHTEQPKLVLTLNYVIILIVFCFFVFTAPKGYHIQLDFRDKFHIEASEDCKYDFLEMRDGPFGYSDSLGRYCGRNHPPLIKTKSRFLWVRFNSDESIEYKGFRAVYEYFKPDLLGNYFYMFAVLIKF